jgi:hypothetical protein
MDVENVWLINFKKKSGFRPLLNGSCNMMIYHKKKNYNAKRLSYYGEKKHQYEPEYTNDNRI